MDILNRHHVCTVACSFDAVLLRDGSHSHDLFHILCTTSTTLPTIALSLELEQIIANSMTFLCNSSAHKHEKTGKTGNTQTHIITIDIIVQDCASCWIPIGVPVYTLKSHYTP